MQPSSKNPKTKNQHRRYKRNVGYYYFIDLGKLVLINQYAQDSWLEGLQHHGCSQKIIFLFFFKKMIIIYCSVIKLNVYIAKDLITVI